jgi:hypothetical protein
MKMRKLRRKGKDKEKNLKRKRGRQDRNSTETAQKSSLGA